ncbi:hypothetical protein L7F22_014165 [Adiantum nelumboides]|nr:hypothetical protein [Adiantum nelumboides]
MDERGVSLQKCQCKYKCRHSSLGYQYVSRRTYYQHLCRERDGHLHPSVTKESFQQNHSDALPSVEAANYSNTLPSVEAANCSNTLPSVEVVVESTPSNQAQRRFWCNCRAYCYGSRFVAPSTYKRHQEANAKYQSLCSTFGLQSLDIPSSLNLENDLLLPSPTCCETSNDPCSLYDENDSVPLVDPVCEEHITADPIYEEHNLTEPVHVNKSYIEETLNGDHEQDHNEDIQLNDKILQKIIEMQALWDEHQVSIEFQDRMLKLLFDKKSNKNSESLSTLLVQLSPSWDGSLGGISVPTSWTQLNTLYRSLGMVDKERYLICMGSKNNAHSPILYEPIAEDSYVGNVVLCRCEGQKKKGKRLKRDCLKCCETCTKCKLPRKEMISFDYLSIEKQLQLISTSRSVCHELLTMWRHRERWLDTEGTYVVPTEIHEFWDGAKCREFQDFWNPTSSFELPVICEHCGYAYKAWPSSLALEELSKNLKGDRYEFTCKSCRRLTKSSRKFCQGDPRNFGLLLHWDGFQSSKTTQRNYGVVEIRVLNSGKDSFLQPLPILFIPFSCKKIIGSSGDLFHVFLQPLVRELERLFVKGFDLTFNYSPSLIDLALPSSKKTTARAMLMVVTGDHPAQCKIGLFKDGGQHFCRRDKAIASLDSSNPSFVGRYIYDKTRLQCRYPPPKRTMAEMQKALYLSVKTTSQSQHDDILKNAGLSGKSSLWRLNDLYGFDLSLDLVYDTMHILSLNIFQKHISLLMRNSSSEMKRKIDDITARALSCVPPALRYGRWPRYPSKYHESYKAEENQKFIQWCLPFVLCEVDGLPSDIQDLGLLLIDIAHLFFNYTRDHGWTNKTIEVARTLLSSWRVRSEEAFGANSSPLEHVAGSGEILDDVLRHGNHDVIWCFLYERLVSTYVNIKSNNKESEISFTNFHRRRLLTWILAQIHKDKDDLLPHQRLYKELHLALIAPAGYVVDSLLQHECQAWHKHGILKVSSVLKAKDLWSALLSNEIDYPCGDSVFDKGIIIGPKRQKWRELSRAEQRFLSQRECRSTHVQEHNKIWYNGEVFKGGDMVIVKSDNYIPGSFSVGEWKARIKYFFSAQCGAKLMLFFAADYYKQSILVEEESERLNVEPITGMSVLQQTPMPFTWDCIREVNSLLHKFIPWSFENSIIAYEIKDLSVRKRLLDVGSVGCVPPWVEEMDIVQIKEYDDHDSSTHTFAYAVVREVDVKRRKVRLTRLLQMQSSAQLWKAGVEDLDWQDTSLCVACSMAQNGRPAPSYADIFCPPEPKLRDPGRLYGKKLLEVYYKDHYPAFLQNYRDVRKWFKDYPFVSDLRHNLEEQGKIKALIEEKKGNLAKFEFQDAAYTWASDDIYQFVISYAQSQRKYDKKKCSKPVFLASNASQGEHDPKNGNLNLNVVMIEEESHSGSEHERTPTTMNLENLDSELENNLEHQSFVSLLTSGNLKRVRAIPQSPKMGMASQLVSKLTSAPLQVLQQDGESTRKSKRERKMSAKLRNSVTGKKPRLLSRKKKRQDIDNLNEDTTMRFVEHVNGENSSYLSNDTIHDRVSLLTVEEKETILLKYFDLQTIEDMCQSFGKSVLKPEFRKTILAFDIFEKWRVDAVSPLAATSQGKCYILTAVDYLSQWGEAKATKKITAKDVVKFVYEDICCKFGVPLELLSDQGPGFRADLLDYLCEKMKITRRLTPPYYPQCKGLIERFNGAFV